MSTKIRLSKSVFKSISINGTLTSDQCKLFRIKYPLEKGWKDKVLNKDIPVKMYDELLRLRGEQINKKEKQRKRSIKSRKPKYIKDTFVEDIQISFVPETKRMTYQEQINHPNWQKMRLYVMDRDGFKCVSCKSKRKQLAVHHTKYVKNKYAWDINPKYLITLCKDCHKDVHSK